jgi:SAM-dependent methyltransferase
VTIMKDNWTSANAYNAFMGRWSRLIALEYIRWLDPSPGLRWLDLGCGTGALTKVLLELTDPTSILACDPSEPLLSVAQRHISDPRVTFLVGGSDNIPRSLGTMDAFVSGLVLNFIPNPKEAIQSSMQHLASGGIVGGYVWDYASRMEFLRVFWEAASAIDATAANLDEGKRFPLCAPDPLRSLFESVGLYEVQVKPLEIKTRFANFADYWEPFLGGIGPAPTFVKSLEPRKRQQLMDHLRARLLPDGDSSFELVARAWAVKGSIFKAG